MTRGGVAVAAMVVTAAVAAAAAVVVTMAVVLTTTRLHRDPHVQHVLQVALVIAGVVLREG